jgi:hypothetical protein
MNVGSASHDVVAPRQAIVAGSVCSKCRASKYEHEEGWTQNGNGILCWFCSDPDRYKEKDEDEGEDYVQDYQSPGCSLPPTPNNGLDGEADVDWYLRAYWAGDVQPKSVELPPLPSSATPAMKKVAEFYALVRGLRLLDERYAGLPVPFGCEWVGRYTGVSTMAAWRAIGRLVGCGVLRRGENLPPRPGMRDPGKRPVHTYLPGDGGGE